MKPKPLTRTLGQRLGRRVNRALLMSRKSVYQALRGRDGDDAPLTLFVAGVQRSGTNMIMGVLERCMDTVVYHERDRRAFVDYELRPREDIRRLVDGAPARVIVLKCLCEMQELGSLMGAFAPARGIWMLRDYRDVVNSHVERWFKMPWFLGEICRDRDGEAGWRGRGMTDESWALLRRLYHDDISNASACALFWYLRNALYFEQGLDNSPDVRIIRYEDLVTAPGRLFPEVFAHAGLDFQPGVARFVTARSVGKRAAPEIEPAIAALCDDLTARFDACLAASASEASAA